MYRLCRGWMSGLVLLSLFVAGCGPVESDSSVLRTYYGQDPDTLNPLTANDTVSHAFQRLVCETLAQRDFANPDAWEPLMAESWDFDEDTQTYTIHLRKGLMWHPAKLPNGRELPETEFTAADVKFTFDCLLNRNIEAASKRTPYENPDATEAADRDRIEVEVVDDYTVKVRWKKPYFMAEDATLDVMMLPKHIFSVDKNGEPISLDVSSSQFAKGFNNHWANTRLYGTGPMMFGEWQRDSRLVLERNPNYWGTPFHFATLVYECIPNSNTSYQKLLQNELDWAGIPEKELYLQAESNPNVVAGRVILHDYPYPAYRYIGYNLKHPFLGEKLVRQALAHAVPVDTIIEQFFKGMAKPVNGPFLAGSSANDESLPPIPFDLDKARALLDEAGWTDTNSDGVRDKLIDGKRVDAKFELNVFSDSPTFQQVGQVIEENFRRIGVEISITPQKWALMLESLDKKDFDATMLGWATDWKVDPFQLFHGSQADVPESSNYGGYRNPELDKLIDELRVTFDEKKQIELYHQIHRIIYEDQPYTFLFSESSTAGQDARIQGIEFYKIRPCTDSRRWTLAEGP